MTDQFQKLLHSGVVDPALLTPQDQIALLELFIKAREQQKVRGGGAFDALPDIRVS
jgi:hypothetical protein